MLMQIIVLRWCCRYWLTKDIGRIVSLGTHGVDRSHI